MQKYIKKKQRCNDKYVFENEKIYFKYRWRPDYRLAHSYSSRGCCGSFFPQYIQRNYY